MEVFDRLVMCAGGKGTAKGVGETAGRRVCPDLTSSLRALARISPDVTKVSSRGAEELCPWVPVDAAPGFRACGGIAYLR